MVEFKKKNILRYDFQKNRKKKENLTDLILISRKRHNKLFLLFSFSALQFAASEIKRKLFFKHKLSLSS